VNIAGRHVEVSIPSAFDLVNNHPNPFNPSTSISYDVPQQAHITLVVYNVLGQDVVRLVDEFKQPGRYIAIWQDRNLNGIGSPPACISTGCQRAPVLLKVSV